MTTASLPAIFFGEEREAVEIIVADAGMTADLAESEAGANGCVDDLEGFEVLQLEIGGFAVFVPVAPDEMEFDGRIDEGTVDGEMLDGGESVQLLAVVVAEDGLGGGEIGGVW